jgi:hypothetical protein
MYVDKIVCLQVTAPPALLFFFFFKKKRKGKKGSGLAGAGYPPGDVRKGLHLPLIHAAVPCHAPGPHRFGKGPVPRAAYSYVTSTTGLLLLLWP